jgi:SAM-dependent methyltransferase
MRIEPMRIVNIGSEPPGQLGPPSGLPPALPPEVVHASGEELEQGWTPMPPAIADAQPTVPVMPAVTDAMIAEAGLTGSATAPPAVAQPSSTGAARAKEAPAASARTVDAARAADEARSAEAARIDRTPTVPGSARARTQPAPPSDHELDELDDASLADSDPDLELIEPDEPVRPPPPPPSAKPQRPATPPPATPPAGPAAAKAATPPLVDDGPKKPKPWWEDLFGDDYLRTFDRLAPRHVQREVDFIEESLGLETGAVILDLACGVGQQTVELASRGYSVVGFDLSLPMLSRAADEAQDRGQRINFLHGDMREMAFDEMFDGIYCWSTSFGYFDEERNLAVLQRIHRALRKGGNFLLDVVNRDYVASRAPSLVWFEGEGCTCMDDMYVDFFTSRLRVKRTAMFDDGHSRELDYSIRLYTLHELGKLLHETGFKVVEVTGHPAHPGVFFGAESPRMIILAERA